MLLPYNQYITSSPSWFMVLLSMYLDFRCRTPSSHAEFAVPICPMCTVVWSFSVMPMMTFGAVVVGHGRLGERDVVAWSY